MDKNRDHKPTVVIRNNNYGNKGDGVECAGSSATSLKRSDSLTKRQKQTANAKRKEEAKSTAAKAAAAVTTTSEEEEEFERLARNAKGTAAKILKTLANQRKIKRRHTVS